MSKINVNFREKDTSRVLGEFRELVGPDSLQRVIGKVYDEVKRRKIVSHALLDRFAIPLGLRAVLSYERRTGRPPKLLERSDLYSAFAFAAGAVEVSKLLSPKGRERLAGMIRDGLSLDRDARCLQHEFTVAAHFSQRGWDIHFVDLAHSIRRSR